MSHASLAVHRDPEAERTGRSSVTGRVLSFVGRLRGVDSGGERADETRPDRELVERFKAGDRQAFGLIYSRHYDMVVRVAWRMVGHQSLAEDIAQDVFVRAWRALARFEARARLSTWLYRVTINACADHLKSGRNRYELQAIEGSIERRPSTAPSAADVLDTERRRALVVDAVRRLPEKYRVVVILRDIEERPYKEIVQILDLPLTTLKMRAIRGREMLVGIVQRMSAS